MTELAKQLDFDTVASFDPGILEARQDVRDMCSADKCMIYFVVNRFQIPRVKALVGQIDRHAFITVTEISDVMGTSVKQK